MLLHLYQLQAIRMDFNYSKQFKLFRYISLPSNIFCLKNFIIKSPKICYLSKNFLSFILDCKFLHFINLILTFLHSVDWNDWKILA